MLSKMFPREGENVPEIRFSGFSDHWKKQRLEDITSKIGSGKTPRGGEKVYVKKGVPLIRSQNIHDDMVDFTDIVYIDDKTNETMENSTVFTDDVLLNITGASIGRSAVYKYIEHANVNQNVCIIRPVSEFDPDFIQLHISSANGQKQIAYSQAGVARESLNFQQISKFEFLFPSFNEQKKIRNYFRYIDTIIITFRRKIDKLKTLKQSLLSKMFI